MSSITLDTERLRALLNDFAGDVRHGSSLPTVFLVDRFMEGIGNAVPLIDLPGSEAWREGYEWGRKLESRFPGQDAADFSYAVREHDAGPVENGTIIDLRMVQQGENDGPDWIWHVTFSNGERWTLQGGCDYTGWDCQSHAEWTKHETF